MHEHILSNSGRAAIFVAVILSAASSGGLAMAGIIHFENPDPGQEGHFNWHWQGPDDERTFENWLDITKPSTDQFGLASGTSVGQLGSRSGDENFTVDGADAAHVDGTLSTRAFEFGENIGDAMFRNFTLHWHIDKGFETEFPENELRYIGVLTSSGNYGWIGVIREQFDLRAVAWAYQTEPGVSINAGEIPTGGTVAVFALAGLGGRRRKRY